MALLPFLFLVDLPSLRSFCPRKSYLCPALHTVPHYPQLNLNMSDAFPTLRHPFSPFSPCKMSFIYSIFLSTSGFGYPTCSQLFLHGFGCLIQLAQFPLLLFYVTRTVFLLNNGNHDIVPSCSVHGFWTFPAQDTYALASYLYLQSWCKMYLIT